MKLLSLFLLICLFSVTSQSQNKLSNKDIEAIKKIEETYRTAWLKNDETTILSLFTENGTLFPNGNPIVKGKSEMQKFWFSPSDTLTIINKYETKIDEIYGEKNLAFAVGTNEIHWSMEKRDKSELKRYLNNSYFMGIYVKQNKGWKILKRIWSGKTQEIK